MSKKKVAFDVTRIPPRPPILHHKVKLAEMLAEDTLEVIKAVQGDLMNAKEATSIIAMKRGIALAAGAERTYLQKVYKMGAGAEGLVISSPVDTKKVRRHDLLLSPEGQVFEVEKSPNESGTWASETPAEFEVRGQLGG